MKKFIYLILFLLLTGCAHKQNAKPLNIADNAFHHVKNALELLEENKIKEANFHIKRALELGTQKSLAYSTKYIITHNIEDLNKAEDNEKNSVDKFCLLLAQIRTANNSQDIEYFVNKVVKIDTSKLILPYYDKGAIFYYAGKRAFNLKEFKAAKQFLLEGFKIKISKFHEKARNLLDKTDKIINLLSLMRYSNEAKKIILNDKIRRIDAAVLLVDELNLNKLLKGAFKSYKKTTHKLPEDVKNHPNRSEVEVLYKYNIRGLGDMVQNSKIGFFPNLPITRAEFALVLEDIISKVKQDESFKRKYFGNKSPFVDVKETSPYFNAIMNAVSMGFMKANKYSEFRPNEPLSGIDLVEAIITIKEELSL